MTDSDSPTDTEMRDMPDDETDQPDQEEPRDSPPRDQSGPEERDDGRPSMSAPPREPGHERPGQGRPPERERRQQPPGRREREDEDTKTKMLRYLYWGGVGLLFLFGAFAGWGFYRSIMRVIDIWVSSDFQPIFRALFNLTVVLVSVLGLSMLIRRMDVAFPSATEE